MIDPQSLSPVDIVGRTAWGEARGGGQTLMHAVISVIMNRAFHPSWMGTDPMSVCLHPWQFSCWNMNDPNRAKMLALNWRDQDYVAALGLAQLAMMNMLPDTTGGADSYFDTSISPPSWAATARHTIDIQNMKFYVVR